MSTTLDGGGRRTVGTRIACSIISRRHRPSQRL